LKCSALGEARRDVVQFREFEKFSPLKKKKKIKVWLQHFI